jgi:hypothetical protein
MTNFSGNVLQKSISKVFPSKIAAEIAEIILLIMIGMLAVTLHAKLRIPMHLPGKQGVLFMIFIVMARSMSKFSFAGSITCLGASALLLFNILGFDDPFMPVVYLLLGFSIDLFFGLFSRLKPAFIFIGLAAALSWSVIPLSRIVISVLTGFPYKSLLSGFAYPVITHFIFGLAGGIFGAGLVLALKKMSSR